MKTTEAVLLLIGVMLAISACDDGSSGDEDSNTSLPWDKPEVSYSLPSTTKYVSQENEASVMSVNEGGETIVLKGGSSLAASVKEGDVLMFGITSQTPNGLLRKVATRIEQGPNVVLETGQATIPEAFEKLDLKLERSLPFSEMQSYETSLEGLELRQFPLTLEGSVGGKFEVDFNGTVLYDQDGDKATTGDQVVADGAISFTVGLVLEVETEWLSLKRMKVGTEMIQKGELSIYTSLPELEFEKELVLADLYFGAFAVGPVVITPNLEMLLGANGELQAQIAVSVTESVKVSTGATYLSGSWTPYSDFTTDWEFDPPSLSASARVKAYVGPRLNLMFYGIAGPYVQVDGYLELEADLNKTPWWSLYVGLEGFLGIKGEILGKELLNYKSGDLLGYREPIAQSDANAECLPNCTGRVCGPDPVCGESCGSCRVGENCQTGECVQGSPVCPAAKDCSGLVCGPDPICGESCGTCGNNKDCEAGKCVGSGSDNDWKDATSGLAWQLEPTGGLMNWSQAKTHCSSISLPGVGWRLPTIGELRSLVRGCSATGTGGPCGVTDSCLASSCSDYEACWGCLDDGGSNNGCYWPTQVQGECGVIFWSDSEITDLAGAAWGVGFTDAMVWDKSISDIGQARCVR